MIEVVATDNRNAEAELLRLAGDFGQSRLFTAKQAKGLHIVVEVSGDGPPRPIARTQLMAKAGMFRASKFTCDFAVSLMHGFEMAVLQMMHELVHIAQVTNNRYQISSTKKKIKGEKVTLYQARWCGKKAGVIDDVDWQERPWEQEAAVMGEQLSAELMAMLYGTQSEFPAQGGKKDLRLQPFAFSLPAMPEAPAMPAIPAMPEEPAFVPAPPAADFDMPAMNVPTGDMPAGDISESNAVDDAALFADIDALLAEDKADQTSAGDSAGPDAPAFDAPAFDAPAFDAPAFDAPAFDTPAPDMAGPDALDEALLADTLGAEADVQETYVLGIAEPRQLKLAVLEAKQRELAERGLLEK